jgi:hypothetical protein
VIDRETQRLVDLRGVERADGDIDVAERRFSSLPFFPAGEIEPRKPVAGRTQIDREHAERPASESPL